MDWFYYLLVVASIAIMTFHAWVVKNHPDKQLAYNDYPDEWLYRGDNAHPSCLSPDSKVETFRIGW